MMALSKTEARERVRHYWSNHATTYDIEHGKHPHDDAQDERASWNELFLQHIPFRSRVLDMGAGTGYCSLLLARLGHMVTALDWSKEMLAQAEHKAAAAGLRIMTQVADLERTPFPEGLFDAITARHVLWTLVQPEKAVAEWHRLLKPGGVAIVDIALGEPGKHYEDAVEAALPLRHISTPEPVLAMFREQGFAEVVLQEGAHPHADGQSHIMVIARR